MMGRVSGFGGVVAAVVFGSVLGSAEVANAGGAHTDPAVRVIAIAPGADNGPRMERDDLPAPQLELARPHDAVELPAVPGFGPALDPGGAAGAADPADRSNPPDIALAVDPAPAPPLRRAIDQSTLDASIGHLNACNQAIAARQYDVAITECRAAITVWPDNHLAWYAWASAHLAKQDWPEALVAAGNAAKRRPDRAMYQLYHGIALYEVERRRVRGRPAHRDPAPSDDAELDRAQLRLTPARDALAAAIRLEPGLWRAHYYLGRVYRDLGDPGRAARQFSAAIQTNPGHRFSYIALSELYRGRDFVDQALAVATLGAARVPPAEAAELWFEVGMAYDAKRADDPAIDAFSRALAARFSEALSKLRRGQLYARKGDLASARRDLEDVLRSPDPRAASAKPEVTRLLRQLADRADAAPRDMRWDCDRGSAGSAIVCRPRSR